jgi:enoyl-CoA hydratase/carnithine racemase
MGKPVGMHLGVDETLRRRVERGCGRLSVPGRIAGGYGVGQAGVLMGQPQINSAIPGALGPWLLRETRGLSRAVELAPTGRLMDAHECLSLSLCLIHKIVPRSAALATSIAAHVARQGVRPGDRVALMVDNGVLILNAGWSARLLN